MDYRCLDGNNTKTCTKKIIAQAWPIVHVRQYPSEVLNLYLNFQNNCFNSRTCLYRNEHSWYSLRIGFRCRLGQRHGLQNTWYMYTFMKVFFKTNLFSYNFHICKLNNLKIIYDLYYQSLTQTLFKTISKSYMEGVCLNTNYIYYPSVPSYKPFCFPVCFLIHVNI
jgi:hypothetical protein